MVHPSEYAYRNYHQEQHSAPLQQQEYHNEHDTNEDIVYGHHDHHDHGQEHDHESVTPQNGLLTNENYPDEKHTQVIFQPTTEPSSYETGGHYESQQHEPSPHPYLSAGAVDTYRAPLVYHKMEQYYNSPNGEQNDGHLGMKHIL